MKEQRKKFLIRFLICLFGIYILITNMFVAIICTVLLMRNNIAVTEYVLSIIYVCLTSFAYYKATTYFLYQKTYKMVETPEKIVIYTNTDKYSIRKTDIKFQKLSLIKLTKLKWKIGVSVNGNKIKIFYIDKKIKE